MWDGGQACYYEIILLEFGKLPDDLLGNLQSKETVLQALIIIQKSKFEVL